MRKLVYAINVTLDGCCDHTRVIADDELHRYYTALVREADTFVYGRITYQLMVPYWPEAARAQSESKAVNDFARAFDAVKQMVVFSRTLGRAEDRRTRIVGTGLRDEILKLKQQAGMDILAGGVDIPSQLMELELMDEYHFVVQPIIAGEGRRLAPALDPKKALRLKLADSRTFKSGCVALRYEK